MNLPDGNVSASFVGQRIIRNWNMKIHTTRFGAIDIEPDDILFFRNGLLGFEDCRHWVLLADSDNTAVAWLQSMQQSDIAMPVVSPRRFVEEYQVRLEPSDVELLQLTAVEQAFVLGIVSRDDDTLTVNLRAPLVINLDRRIGSQVVTVDNQPMQYDLATLPTSLRRTA
ncbi:MAG: flagellar assembly protein FliW [Mariniblastus sp.]|nr:flagellar assembly protein FliW [Mariniblastus sp.]